MSAPESPPPGPCSPGVGLGKIERSTVLIAALRVSEVAPSVQEDCVRQILHDLEQNGYPAPRRIEDLETQVAEAFRVLSSAGLLEPDRFGRCSLTLRGQQVLRDNPEGLATSLADQYPKHRR